MLQDAVQSLIATARDDRSSSESDLNAAMESFFNAASNASVDEANAAIHELSNHFRLGDISRGGILALVCGALVERGCDPMAIAEPLTERLGSLLESSVSLADACVAAIPESDAEDRDTIDEFEKARQQVGLKMPAQNAAWEALEQFWRPAIAVYSVSPESRRAARPLRERAAKISEYHEGGYWLRLMLSVLDNEPILVIEPHTTLGIVGRISGVVDNFQLNTLIMDQFPRTGFFSRRRVAHRVAEVARGKGPQQTNDTVTGVWNLYTWQAIQPDLKVPDLHVDEAVAFWVWNEGSPEDIPVFKGHRVVLLGPRSYPRMWQSQRMFDKLPAELTCDRQFTKEETRAWLERMMLAKGAG